MTMSSSQLTACKIIHLIPIQDKHDPLIVLLGLTIGLFGILFRFRKTQESFVMKPAHQD